MSFRHHRCSDFDDVPDSVLDEVPRSDSWDVPGPNPMISVNVEAMVKPSYLQYLVYSSIHLLYCFITQCNKWTNE